MWRTMNVSMCSASPRALPLSTSAMPEGCPGALALGARLAVQHASPRLLQLLLGHAELAEVQRRSVLDDSHHAVEAHVPEPLVQPHQTVDARAHHGPDAVHTVLTRLASPPASRIGAQSMTDTRPTVFSATLLPPGVSTNVTFRVLCSSQPLARSTFQLSRFAAKRSW